MREEGELYFWQNGGEIDLVIRRGTAVRTLVQVVYEGLEDSSVAKRELTSLSEAKRGFPKAERIVVVGRAPATATLSANGVRIIPLWRFLLGER